jgi:hypothetical protein
VQCPAEIVAPSAGISKVVHRTCAALGLRQLLIDEGPRMLRLATECVAQTESSLADDAITANLRDFALHLAEKPAL